MYRGLTESPWRMTIKGFQKKLGTSNSLVAELWRIRDGLTLVKSMGINDNHVEFDANEAICMIVEKVDNDRTLMPLIFGCRKLLLEFLKFKLIHIYREVNGVADQLPKATVRFEEHFVILYDHMLEVLSLIKADMSGLAKARLVAPN